MQERVPAKLVVIGGELAGHVYSLETTTVTFGRDSSNSIGVPDAALSRLHCVFSFEPDGWTVRDVGSSNGTFVNGRQVELHVLEDGDRIAAGSNLLLFAHDASALARAVAFDEDAPLTPTRRLALQDVIYFGSGSAPPALNHGAEGLKALLAISTAIHAVRDEGQLHVKLLDLLFEALPVAEGVILRPGANAELDIQAVRPVASPSLVHINSAVISRVMGEGVGILFTPTSGRTTAAEQVRPDDARVPSVVAVPLSVQGQLLGLIYLTSRARAVFTDDHLQLAAAVARISSVAIDNLRRFGALERETERLQADLHLTCQMVGSSPAIAAVHTRIAKVARVDTTVLVTGETGTGKELAARAIHLNSTRARKPFVAINCAALTESLLESELFGHERGAFTGAVAQKKGRLELADGGTVFLDEVGELAFALQSKLLRVLQQRELERVGGTRTISVDLRILSATNRDLRAAVDAGTFRQDLYYRLNVVSIHVPPLRDRPGDIAMLARHFLAVYAPKSGRRITAISAQAMQRMLDYDWPGNVRELENAIERACVLGSSDQIQPEDLPETLIDTTSPPVEDSGLHACVLAAKRRAVITAFHRAGGSYIETARLLGVHPNYLHRLIRNLKIKTTLDNQEA
jgi:transcriptional regulator with GAF, ATPase, and Fis domain